MRKSKILGFSIVTILIILGVTYINLENTYISNNNDSECIVVKDNLEHVVNSGLKEFPNCNAIKKGFKGSVKFIAVNCSNGHVITSSYVAFNNNDTCENYVKLSEKEKQIFIYGK